MISLFIPIDLYLNYVVVFIGGTSMDGIEKIEKTLKKRIPEKERNHLEDSGGFCYSESCPVFIWLPNITNKSIVFHEISHATDIIFDYCSIPHIMETTEVYAFMNGYLASEVYKRYEKLKKDIKNEKPNSKNTKKTKTKKGK